MAGMQIGTGKSYRDGILGTTMAMGPGRAMRDGVLGAPLATGRGAAFRDGSLGCAGGCGRIRGLGEGPSDIKIGDLFSLDLLIGGAIGAAVTYFYLTSQPQPRRA